MTMPGTRDDDGIVSSTRPTLDDSHNAVTTPETALTFITA